jgi:hypothetical protein
MNENTSLTIIIVTFLILTFGGIQLNNYDTRRENTKVKIACYEAAKTNQNLKCE